MNVETVTNPGYEQPKKKSNKAFFACGGIGCISLFLVCGLGIAAIAYVSFGAMQVFEEAKVKVTESKAVIDALGEPLEFGAPAQNTDGNQAEGQIGFDQSIKGPNGDGTVKLLMKYEPPATFTLEGLKVDVDGADDIDVMNSNDIPEIDVEDVTDESSLDADSEDSE